MRVSKVELELLGNDAHEREVGLGAATQQSKTWTSDERLTPIGLQTLKGSRFRRHTDVMLPYVGTPVVTGEVQRLV